MAKSQTQDPFEAFDEIERQRQACLTNAVNQAQEAINNQRAEKQAKESSQNLAEATNEYQQEVAAELRRHETRRNRANTRALHKANGTTPAAPATSGDTPKVKSRFAGHREGTQGFVMDKAIGQFLDANGRLPSRAELHKMLPQFTEERCAGHMSFLKRKGFLPVDATAEQVE